MKIRHLPLLLLPTLAGCSDEQAATLRQAVRNAQLLFANGLANYLEVITAQSNGLQSELELATIQKAQLDATVTLYRAVGGGGR